MVRRCGAAARAAMLATFVVMAASGGMVQATPGGPSAPVSQAPDTPAPAPQESAATEPAAPNSAGQGQAGAPPEGEPLTTADGTLANMGQYGGSNHVIFIGAGLLLLLVAAAVVWLFVRRRGAPKASQESKEPGMGYDNRPSSRRSLVPEDHRETVISDLLRRVQVLEQRVTALENGGAVRARSAVPEAPPSSARPPSGYGAETQDNYYDRKREPQDLPEDTWASPQRAPTPAYQAEPQRAAPSRAGSTQQFADELAELFNRAGKPDFDALASRFGAESYTNDRRSDLAQLIKDDLDRFWVVPVPGQPDLALMIPGFTVKKSWAKLRQPETDHPLAYHFELRRGDRLQVIRPAVLRRNSNNFWELEQKGEVVGIS